MAFGLEGEDLWQAATGFAGGFARAQDVCGALCGATIATSMAMGRRGGSRVEIRDRTYKMVRATYDRFVQRFGAADCRTLTGFDFNEPDGFKRFQEATPKADRCTPFVRFATETVVELEQQRRNQEVTPS